MIPVNEPLLIGREIEYVNDCLKTGWISSAGKYIERFETEWASYCKRRFGVAVINGTVALELGLSVLDLPEESEVILPTFTIVSCLEAVLRNGLKPILVDADPLTFCMDVGQVASSVGKNTSCIMPVHIYGHPVNMASLLPLADRYQLKILEDAAEVHGAECCIDGSWRRCGSFGEVSAFSFYANKNVTTGEGGMVLTDDESLSQRMRDRRTLCFGHKERFCHEDRGWNFRMTNLQAALGCAQLETIDHHLKRKKDLMNAYNTGLQKLPLQLPHVEPWAKSTVWMYTVVLHDDVAFDAAEFARRLNAEGVQTRPFFRGLHSQPVYQRMGLFRAEHFPVSDRLYQRGLYLPSGQAITDEQIEEVIKAVSKVLS